jgi:hypothetical protein
VAGFGDPGFFRQQILDTDGDDHRSAHPTDHRLNGTLEQSAASLIERVMHPLHREADAGCRWLSERIQDRVQLWLPRDYYVRSGSNDYSAHPSVVGRRCWVPADLDRVRVWCEGDLVATIYGLGAAPTDH